MCVILLSVKACKSWVIFIMKGEKGVIFSPTIFLQYIFVEVTFESNFYSQSKEQCIWEVCLTFAPVKKRDCTTHQSDYMSEKVQKVGIKINKDLHDFSYVFPIITFLMSYLQLYLG